MHRIRGMLSYSNVVATVAFFLVLAGGTAFAAKNMLPKNSVGTKQIKNGAITGAKIKNGAVTGAKIQTSSLGTVPNASHADSATTAGTAASASNATNATNAVNAVTATNAANAKALDGLEAGAFAPSNREFFGSAAVGATAQTLFTAAGIEVRTVAGAGNLFKVAFHNTNSQTWEVSSSTESAIVLAAPGGTDSEAPAGVRVASFTVADSQDFSKVLFVQCGSNFGPDELYCTGRLSPAAA
jgi:hypothetical protein